LALPRVPHPDVPCLVSPSFSAVHPWQAELPVLRVRRCVRVSAGRCIPRDRRLQERVRWAWVRRFHLPGQRGLAAVRAVQHGGPASAMFRVA
jgi:hypothetical protein